MCGPLRPQLENYWNGQHLLNHWAEAEVFLLQAEWDRITWIYLVDWKQVISENMNMLMKTCILHKIVAVAMGNCLLAVTMSWFLSLGRNLMLVFNWRNLLQNHKQITTLTVFYPFPFSQTLNYQLLKYSLFLLLGWTLAGATRSFFSCEPEDRDKKTWDLVILLSRI